MVRFATFLGFLMGLIIGNDSFTVVPFFDASIVRYVCFGFYACKVRSVCFIRNYQAVLIDIFAVCAIVAFVCLALVSGSENPFADMVSEKL